MSKTKQQLEQIQNNEPVEVQYDEDFLYEQYLTQEKLNEEYWQQRAIEDHYDMINAQYETRFCFVDVLVAVAEVTGDERLAEEVGRKLNELYVRRMTFDAQINS